MFCKISTFLWLLGCSTLSCVALELSPISTRHAHTILRRDGASGAQNTTGLDLLDYESFYWGDPDNSFYANLTLHFKEEYEFIIGMDSFDPLLKTVVCGNPMVLEFNDEPSFNQATDMWNWVNNDTNYYFIMVAEPDKCGTGTERQPYLVTNMTFDPQKYEVSLAAEPKAWGDVAKNYTFKLGYTQGFNATTPQKRGADVTLNMASNFNRNLFNEKVAGVDLSIDCSNCGTTGRLLVDFDLDIGWSLKPKVSMKVNPQNLAAFLQLTMSASGTLSKDWTWQKTIVSIPIEGIEVGGFAKIGAFLDVDVGISLDEWTGNAEASFGAKMALSNSAVIDINIMDPTSGKFSGWTPALSALPFGLDAKVEGGLQLYAEPSLSLSAEAFDYGIELDLDLQMPYIDIDFTALANLGGVCGTEKTLGVDLDAHAGVDLSVQVAKASDKGNPLWQQSLFNHDWYLFSKCYGFGPDNAKKGATGGGGGGVTKTKTKTKMTKTKTAPKTTEKSPPAKTLKPTKKTTTKKTTTKKTTTTKHTTEETTKKTTDATTPKKTTTHTTEAHTTEAHTTEPTHTKTTDDGDTATTHHSKTETHDTKATSESKTGKTTEKSSTSEKETKSHTEATETKSTTEPGETSKTDSTSAPTHTESHSATSGTESATSVTASVTSETQSATSGTESTSQTSTSSMSTFQTSTRSDTTSFSATRTESSTESSSSTSSSSSSSESACPTSGCSVCALEDVPDTALDKRTGDKSVTLKCDDVTEKLDAGPYYQPAESGNSNFKIAPWFRPQNLLDFSIYRMISEPSRNPSACSYNTEHVYEANWIPMFLLNLTGNGQLTCDELKEVFFTPVTDKTPSGKTMWGDEVISQLGSNVHQDLLVMLSTGAVNSRKNKIFAFQNALGDEFKNGNGIKKMQYLSQVGRAMNYMAMDGIGQVMQDTAVAIEGSLAHLGESLLKTNAALAEKLGGTDENPGFLKSRHRAWLRDHINDANQRVWAAFPGWATDTDTAITKDKSAGTSTQTYKTFLAGLSSASKASTVVSGMDVNVWLKPV